ncbi:ketoacyl-ACP synthase III [bacterium]|nr:ketoacyl-ACP synthase III [bacterium]MBU1072222.1 ketoacyl-ACP synthase III [bacterium]
MRNVSFAGTGYHLPERIVTNDDLARLIDTSDDWIRERSGIRERRWIEPGQTLAGLGAAAARMAMDDAGVGPRDIDLVICATISGDHFFPGNGVLLQRDLGLGPVAALDVRNQCTGFIYGVATAAAFIRSEQADTALVVGAEVQSTALDLSDRGRDMAVLFGDGAGAAVLRAADEGGDVLASALHSQGKFHDALWCEMPSCHVPGRIDGTHLAEGRHHPRMNGRLVFKHAVRRFCEAIEEVLEKGGATRDDIALVIPHQANLRITEAVAKRFELAPQQVFSNIHKYGNTTAASIPIALAEAAREGRLERGDLLVLVAFGSGFTWGANLIRW